MKKKNVLITDLDNTLFDWVDIWVNCFSAMLEEICAVSGIERDVLIPEISAIHKKHGTSEYAFLIEEIPSLRKTRGDRPAAEVFSTAILAYHKKRKEYLKLYPGVMETMKEIKRRGSKIIGYTESMAFYSNYRIRRLGLDGILDYIFCPRDHAIPEGIGKDELRFYPEDQYDLKYTIQDFTPMGSKKPDSAVLEEIILKLGLSKGGCVYVGDSLMKDVVMALDCGVEDVWAKYGRAHGRPEYSLLAEVTHWTEEDVEREKKINEREHIIPTHIIENDFSELLEIFDFRESIE